MTERPRRGTRMKYQLNIERVQDGKWPAAYPAAAAAVLTPHWAPSLLPTGVLRPTRPLGAVRMAEVHHHHR